MDWNMWNDGRTSKYSVLVPEVTLVIDSAEGEPNLLICFWSSFEGRYGTFFFLGAPDPEFSGSTLRSPWKEGILDASSGLWAVVSIAFADAKSSYDGGLGGMFDFDFSGRSGAIDFVLDYLWTWKMCEDEQECIRQDCLISMKLRTYRNEDWEKTHIHVILTKDRATVYTLETILYDSTWLLVHAQHWHSTKSDWHANR